MNKNENTKRNRVTDLKNILIAFGVFVIGTSTIACSTLRGFTRSTAAGLIQNDNRYKSPATLTIDIDGRLTNAGAEAEQLSPNESAEAAIPRAREDFGKRQPQIIVAENLGYIKLYFEKAELIKVETYQSGFRPGTMVWKFRPRAEITDKGRALWKDLSFNVDEESLPLAVRETPEITGLKDENQTLKSGDFTYKWKPTELGEAFSTSSSTFKNLSPDLQKALQETKFDMFGQGNNNIMDFDKPRMGKANFQKFDDGWRLSQLYFM